MGTPEHVALTMDGNRRWAESHGVSTYEGHLAGAKRIEPIVEEAAKSGISYLSFYSFSTENWSRPEQEKDHIMNVFREMLRSPIPKRLKENGVKVNIIGDYGRFPSDIVTEIESIQDTSDTNNQLTVNFALGYGGKDEVVRATNKLLELGVSRVTPELLNSYLDTAGQPDVDLLIRTGGQQRTSGFLMWQSVYAELFFTPTLWPDFTPRKFQEALEWYDSEKRRFGK